MLALVLTRVYLDLRYILGALLVEVRACGIAAELEAQAVISRGILVNADTAVLLPAVAVREGGAACTKMLKILSATGRQKLGGIPTLMPFRSAGA